jgi:hypothetical protein
MGMSTRVVGFRPPDAKWKRMKDIYDACESAEIELPAAVMEFFDGEDPNDSPGGVLVDLDKSKCVTPYRSDDAEGFDVDITKLPKDVTILRFTNSW